MGSIIMEKLKWYQNGNNSSGSIGTDPQKGIMGKRILCYDVKPVLKLSWWVQEPWPSHSKVEVETEEYDFNESSLEKIKEKLQCTYTTIIDSNKEE